MGVEVLGKIAKQMDRRFGIRERLKGEPRPPVGGFDLDGEKVIDWGWICVNLPRGPLRGLEIGCGSSPVLPAMVALGYEAFGVDLDDKVSKQISGFTFVRGDFNQVSLTPSFDVIVACSAIEHVGLAGRFGSSEDVDGDLKAMRKIVSLLKPEGQLLLTIPVGMDVVHRPWHRVYGRKRLPLLLSGLQAIRSRYLVKTPWGPWRETSESEALNCPEDIHRYALGEMILSRQ